MRPVWSCQIPPDLLCLILEYEGSIITAFRLDYIQCVYVGTYRRLFGGQTSLHAHSMIYLEMAKLIHASNLSRDLKQRKSRKYMLPWRRAFGKGIRRFLPTIKRKALCVPEPYEPRVLKMMLNGWTISGLVTDAKYELVQNGHYCAIAKLPLGTSSGWLSFWV